MSTNQNANKSSVVDRVLDIFATFQQPIQITYEGVRSVAFTTDHLTSASMRMLLEECTGIYVETASDGQNLEIFVALKKAGGE